MRGGAVNSNYINVEEDHMNATGVIAEYNPFHNGHKYQLEQLRKLTRNDYIIVAMSGDFLQRGACAVLDKYTRTEMALKNGADLVLELPVVSATASAEYFAKAGIRLLCSTGVVNHIGYGVESLQPELSAALINLLSDAPEAYDRKIAQYQKSGNSYPVSREKALISLLPEFDAEQIQSFLKQPNNILSLEYEKALAGWNRENNRSVAGVPVARIGDGYHDTKATCAYASATAIRRLLEEDHAKITGQNLMPESASALLADNFRQKLTRTTNDFSSVLYAKLLSEQEFGYETYADCSHDLSCKIAKRLPEFKSFEQFCMLLKSRDLTYTRISRVLFHILLGITKEDYAFSASRAAYLRVLGFRRDAAPLLSAIKKNSDLPLVTKVADASAILPADTYTLLKKDLYAADLYRGVCQVCSGLTLPNEFTHELVIV
jgi:predicted nucleotidyltransferase